MSSRFLSGLTGSFSQPAGDNPTGPMIEAAYRRHGIEARYVNCEVAPAELGAAVRGAVAMGWLGFNCSLPHKVAVLEHLDELSDAAAIIGAVNCVAVRRGRLVGDNTDGKGFLASLRDVLEPAGCRVVVLGAGGAARAIAVELALAGAASVRVVNRHLERAQELAAHVAAHTAAGASAEPWVGDYAVPADVDVLVNATSIGLHPDVASSPPVAAGSLRPGLVVADVIPNPPQTALLRAAAEHGCVTVNGLGMLVNQAVAGIRLWTGIDVDPGVMHAELTRLFTTS